MIMIIMMIIINKTKIDFLLRIPFVDSVSYVVRNSSFGDSRVVVSSDVLLVCWR